MLTEDSSIQVSSFSLTFLEECIYDALDEVGMLEFLDNQRFSIHLKTLDFVPFVVQHFTFRCK
jgi:hypothetical protein